MMKRLPFLLGFLFIVITTSRVADFMEGGYLAWISAIALSASVYVSAYHVQDMRTRKAAFWSLIFFGIFDCIFNFGETIKWSVDEGRWNFILNFGSSSIYLYRFADVAYGLFPTVSAAILANLARVIELQKEPEVILKISEPIQEEVPTIFEPSEEKVIAEEVIPIEVPKTKTEFLKQWKEGVLSLPEKGNVSEFAKQFPVSERSVRNWLAEVQNGHGGRK